ncbi:MAG TPA: formate dehydrogenase subunit alpha [Solirubrobacteraceae bacterium]|nr:formate dehydrogenase subunit alpha [Solirubrobacteraceae bacterium]
MEHPGADAALLEAAAEGALQPEGAGTLTTCGYCGVGCRLRAHVHAGSLLSITPALEGPANRGHACLKGRFAHRFARSRERLTEPLIRRGGRLVAVSWEEAIATVADRLGAIRRDHGADAIAGLASSRGTNEECFAMARLMRAAIGTNNIDNCSRVCHSPTSYALRRSLGLSGATGTFDDIERAQAAIIIGANPTQAHPVVGARIKQAALRGLALVTIDPRRIELADYGVLHIGIRAGTNAAVLLGIAHVLVREGLIDEDFIAQRTEGYETLAALLDAYDPPTAGAIAGCDPQAIEEAAHIYGDCERASILWGLGVTEHRYGSEVAQLICNLALLSGKIGAPGCALLPLRGQNNVQGSSDMGALPDTYSAYRSVTDEAVAGSFEAAWGTPLSRRPGYRIPEMLDGACAGDLKAMYIVGEDIAQTDPNSAHVRAALEALDFLVCQEIFENETTAYADVILPASSFLEKEGTFTNAERRIQHVAPALAPPGQARTDLEIIVDVARALGHEMGYRAPADVMAEIAALTPHFAGVTYERLGDTGLCWPVHADGSDSAILYTDRFHTASGRGRLAALPYKPPGEQPDAELPLTLVTGRILEHYNAGTMTRRTPNLALCDHDRLEINPIDARRLWISEGATVSVRSRHGRCELRASLSERIEPGHVFASFHFPESRTNLLVGASADVNTACPEYKVVAVDVRPLSEAPSQRPALASGR